MKIETYFLGFPGNGSRTGSSFSTGPGFGSGTLCDTMPSVGSSAGPRSSPAQAVALTPGLALAPCASVGSTSNDSSSGSSGCSSSSTCLLETRMSLCFRLFPLFLKINSLLVVAPKSLIPGASGVEEVQQVLG